MCDILGDLRKFLKERGWEQKSDDEHFYLYPPEDLGIEEEGFYVKIPRSKDYVDYDIVKRQQLRFACELYGTGEVLQGISKVDTSWKDDLPKNKTEDIWDHRAFTIALSVISALDSMNKDKYWLADQVGVSYDWMERFARNKLGRDELNMYEIASMEAALGRPLIEVEGFSFSPNDDIDFNGEEEQD